VIENKKRQGVSSIEFLVSFSVMTIVMTLATTMALNINRVWRDIEHQRLAVCELSNQLEELTQLAEEELIEKVKQIEPSEFCTQGLHEPQISGKLTSDDLGQRIDLELIWKQQPVDRKVRLSGWARDRGLDAAEQENEGEQR